MEMKWKKSSSTLGEGLPNPNSLKPQESKMITKKLSSNLDPAAPGSSICFIQSYRCKYEITD